MQGLSVFPIGLDVDWQSASTSHISDHYINNWLVDTGSLTERIQSLCRHFQVQKLGQGNAPLHQHESALLSGKAHDYEVREVVLLADDAPWVFARSIVPKSLSKGEWRHLGSKPLGQLLFNDNRFNRSAFDIATLNTQHFSMLPIEQTQYNLYGRRSLFTLDTLQVLVAEVFLPASPVYRNLVC